jgi:TDG/mug DNA glycosylase family protein
MFHEIPKGRPFLPSSARPEIRDDITTGPGQRCSRGLDRPVLFLKADKTHIPGDAGEVKIAFMDAHPMNRTLSTPWKPTKAQILAAQNKVIPDIAERNLVVLFVGINPGLYTAAIGHHFGRPGNRFWPALHGGGFTPRLFSPFEETLLLDLKLGITNVVERATARADELTDGELRAGGKRLEAKVELWRPTVVAFVGIGPYRVVSGNKKAGVGLQLTPFGGSHAWVLPNPSGLNAHYQPAALAQLFGELHLWAMAKHKDSQD